MKTNTQKKKSHFRRNWFFYILLLAITGIAGYNWLDKDIALKKQLNHFKAEKNMQELLLHEACHRNAIEHIELLMETFAWAVKGELTRDNLEQVDQYFKHLVKDKKILEIVLIDREGIVKLSTNKKNEGLPLATDYATTVTEIEDMKIINDNNKRIVATPIMSLNHRLGTLILIIKDDTFE